MHTAAIVALLVVSPLPALLGARRSGTRFATGLARAGFTRTMCSGQACLHGLAHA